MTWSSDSLDRVPAFIEIVETGTHTLNVWPRSNDIRFDRIVLTDDPDYQPPWSGPDLSLQLTRQLRPPAFSRTSGLFSSSVAVNILSPGPGADIHYTTDGSDPLSSDTASIYRQPITINDSKRITAIATSDAARPSDARSVLLTRTECEPIRIMPLGDSITLGIFGPIEAGPLSGDLGGYRAHLYRRLIESGFAVDFVGSLKDGTQIEPPIDPDHEGRDGWTNEQIAANVYGFLSKNPPHVVLMHVGTNGVTPDVSGVAKILDEIDRFESDRAVSIRVFLARIIDRRVPHDETSQYNSNLDRMVETRVERGDMIHVVDMQNALEYPDDLYDKLHPEYARLQANGRHLVHRSCDRCSALRELTKPYSNPAFTTSMRIAHTASSRRCA